MARKKPSPAAVESPSVSSTPESGAEKHTTDRPSFPIVGVGASAGGLEAFTQLLNALPADTGMAFVLVVHLDPTHGSMLAEILSRATKMPVTQVVDEPKVEPNHVYVIPPNRNITIAQGVLKLSLRTEPRGMQRSVDHFFRSLAEDLGPRAIGVVLSGTASDGTLGLQEIKAEGGITFAQDDTAQQDSMPRSAIAAGCVDFVMSPQEIGQELTRIARQLPALVQDEIEAPSPAREPNLGKVIELLRHGTGVDFSNYKRNTLYRRITRRMVLHKMEGLREYVQFLQGNPPEIEALYQDILISVTSFFRNPEAFEVLKLKVFPKLIHNRSRHEPVRIWVMGCSTGEEAYSLAMAFSEFVEAANRPFQLQVFATDLNGAGIEKARAGVFSKTILQDVSPERMRRFFVDVDGSYRVAKSIRDVCVFARHNGLSDPPFSHVDLISCRNLLIYLEPVLQQRLVPTLHYALNPGGFLWLGSSETIGSYRETFQLEDTKHKIYLKKTAPVRVVLPVGEQTPGTLPFGQRHRQRETRVQEVDLQKEADRILLSKFVPPGVLVNAELDVLQFRGDTGAYLTPAPGKATLNLLKMLREGLLVAVRGAVQRARREETIVREENLRVKANGGFRDVNVQVIPVKGSSGPAGSFLVLFEPPAGRQTPAKGKREPAPPSVEQDGSEREITRLKQDLSATREYLQSVIEQQEAANEELQSANEEVQSANEELQSINEELETSKEEIQSSNEELATVNDELQNRNLDLSQSHNDMSNLLASVQMAIVMIGPDLRIRRFTPMAEKMLNLIATDVGRPISDIKLNINIPNLEHLLTEVIDAVTPKEHEAQDKGGRWYSLRIRPYRTLEKRIDGAVLVLVDIDALKRTQESLQRQAELMEQVSEPIVMWEPDGKIIYWNKGAEEVYGYTRPQALERNLHALLNTTPPTRLWKELLDKHGRWTGELTHTRRDGQKVVVEARMVVVEPGGGRLVIEAMRPITERKQTEQYLRTRAEELVRTDRNRNEFLAMLAHELRNPLGAIGNATQVLAAPGADAATHADARDILGRQTLNMSRLIDDLLDAARITTGKIALQQEPIDLKALLRRAEEQAQRSADCVGRRITLKLPPEPLVVHADSLRLEQVFTNLIHNGCKFTTAEGEIAISAECISGQAVVRVRDNGDGMEPATIAHVFDMFMQADHLHQHNHGGLGIGLTLAKQLVELHGGTIEAFSDGPGKGSEFVVRLPLHGSPVPQNTSAPRLPAAQPQPARILVVEDNADAARSLATLLSMAHHEVQVAHDGAAALQIAAAFQPQVCLVDIGLPGMNGIDLGNQLRRQKGLEKTLLLAVSGFGHDESRRLTREADFDHHLTKPLDLSLLNRIIVDAQTKRK